MNPQSTPYLVLRIAGSYCALPVARIAEVLRPPLLLADTRRIPGLLGLARLRGEPVPVFSLATLLGIVPEGESSAAATSQRLLRLALNGQCVALLVDEVLGIQSLSSDALKTIDLPGGREQTLGRFDHAFAELLNVSGLLPDLAAAEPA